MYTIGREFQTASVADSETIIADSESEEQRYLLSGVLHPRRNGLPGVLFERRAEGAVATEAAIVGQLLGGERTLVSDGIVVEVDEMADAQAVDVGVVGQPLLGEMLAEVVMVGTYGL